MLDITLKFSDGVQLPLHYISKDDYDLDTDTLNDKIVSFIDSDKTTPRIQAISSGRGKLLKIVLELNEQCNLKKTHVLASSTVDIEVEYPEETYKHTQSDMSSITNIRESYATKDVKASAGLQKKSNSNKLMNPQTSSHDSQRIATVSAMSPLEIGMYVLLAIFCVAVAVFMVNCFVFVMKYRKKRKPSYVESKGTVTQARDWVWIGRDTLERNAISTNCSTQPTIPSQAPTPHVLTATWNRQASSLHKGSDGSIRITANPMMVDSTHSSCKEGSETGDDDDEAGCEECAMMARERDADDAISCDECHLMQHGMAMQPVACCGLREAERSAGGEILWNGQEPIQQTATTWSHEEKSASNWNTTNETAL